MIKILGLWALTLSFGVWALDLDEKLTLRILKHSKTKKTVLINRGLEDGLNVGDHAKFYVTSGMIARGVVVKTSPARSIWSLYRLIDPTFLEKDKVMNLKIASPVKISPDSSKMIMVEPVAVPGEDIPIASEAEFLEAADGDIQEDERREQLQELQEEGVGDEEFFGEAGTQGGGADASFSSSPSPYKRSAGIPMKGRAWEIMAYGNTNLLSGKIESANKTDSKVGSGSMGGLNLTLALEKALSSKFFLRGLVSFEINEAIGVDAHNLSSHFLGFGGALGYSFAKGHSPRAARPLTYAIFGFGFGSSKDISKLKGQNAVSENFKGDGTFLYGGFGLKHRLNPWGLLVQLDFYRRLETYLIDNIKKNKVLIGPRLLVGATYTF
ncbi:MAG: hypothetical protein OXB88_07635 [Bacteriovoracales bacterium]|nr:hypothetical protein [Bacteriovoracales bacterium]